MEVIIYSVRAIYLANNNSNNKKHNKYDDNKVTGRWTMMMTMQRRTTTRIAIDAIYSAAGDLFGYQQQQRGFNSQH